MAWSAFRIPRLLLAGVPDRRSGETGQVTGAGGGGPVIYRGESGNVRTVTVQPIIFQGTDGLRKE